MAPRRSCPPIVPHAHLSFSDRRAYRMAMPVHAPPPDPGHWTIDRLDALPEDGNRYEIIDGALYVTPSPVPLHQRAVRHLAFALDSYLGDRGASEVFFAPFDVIFAQDTVVQPDVLVVPRLSSSEARRRSEGSRPLLAIEVLSPSSARTDRQAKRELYQREGVPEYWIVDLDARLVERWRPEDRRPEILTDEIQWHADDGVSPLVIPLRELFARVCDD